jgi:hypothetical protein
MKRVRLVAGLAGMAPAALGMAAIPAAQAHASTSPNATGCTGTIRGNIPANPNTHLRGHFWYTQHGSHWCIGTVDASMFYTKSVCKVESIEVLGGPGGHSLYNHRWANTCATPSVWRSFTVGVHRSFQNAPDGQLAVCLNSTYGTKADCLYLLDET